MNQGVYKKILFYLTIACLLTPFFVDAKTYFPFIIGKATVFRFLVEIMLVLWALMLIKKETKFKLNKLSKALLIYALVIFLAAIFGVNFSWSFFSGNERMEGVFGIWHFILFFLILISVFDRKKIENILKIQVGIGVVYSLMALSSYWKISTIIVNFTAERLVGYTGNPSFFATYLIFNALLALYFYFEEFEINKKLLNFWLPISIFQGILVFVTGTRGGMAGLGIGCLFLIFSLLFSKKDQKYQTFKKILAGGLILGVLFVILVFSFKNSTLVQKNFALKRLTSVSLKDPTAVSRILSAGIAWRSFLEKPLLGWGPENYEAAYIKNFDPKIIEALPGDFYFDRAHNKPMEVLATTGILGFISYIGIFVFSFLILNNCKKKKGNLLGIITLESLIIAYFVQNIFLFDFHESYLMFILVLVFIHFLGEENFVEEKTKQISNKQIEFSKELLSYLIFFGTSGLVIISLVFGVVKPFLTSRNIFFTNYYSKRNKTEEALKTLKSAIRSPSFLSADIVMGFKKGYSENAYFLDEAGKKSLVETAVSFGEKLIDKDYVQYQILMAMADLELSMGQWEPLRIDKALEITERVLKLTPYFPNTHLLVAKTYFLDGQEEKGMEEAKKALELNPQLAVGYYILYLGYKNQGNTELAEENLLKSAQLRFLFGETQTIHSAAKLAITAKDYQTLEFLYQLGIQLEPKEYTWYVSLAATYGKMHNKEKAIEYAKKAAELNPDLKQESENFIQLIERGEWDKILD
ncbi:MAG: O-antigen ligase family protein [Candidatus Paceibacterota bacterium]|jgi:O-antigen ligase